MALAARSAAVLVALASDNVEALPPHDTRSGTNALANVTTGDGNTADGYSALQFTTTGGRNTGVGSLALTNNVTGSYNTAVGYAALTNNTVSDNSAFGYEALTSNTSGTLNTACGSLALLNNTTASFNTATGREALNLNSTGANNVANGYQALLKNGNGSYNVAIGDGALLNNTTGGSNIALGEDAGFNLTTGSNNICIGNKGLAAESNAIRIGVQGTQTGAYVSGISGVTLASGTPVRVSGAGRLGILTSSRRFKQDIANMAGASDALLSLRPVTFRYKTDIDPQGIPQFGLIAEEVEKVAPELVARDEKGEIFTVRYEAVNAMLLNEFLKEHRRVEAEVERNAKQEKTIAERDEQIRALAATVATLEARDKAREVRLTRLEAALDNRPAPAANASLDLK